MVRFLVAAFLFLAALGGLFLIVFLPVLGLLVALALLVVLLALGGVAGAAWRMRQRRRAAPPVG